MHKELAMSESGQRFVGIDLHKAYIMIGAVDASKQVILPPRRVALTEFDAWAKRHFRRARARRHRSRSHHGLGHNRARAPCGCQCARRRRA